MIEKFLCAPLSFLQSSLHGQSNAFLTQRAPGRQAAMPTRRLGRPAWNQRLAWGGRSATWSATLSPPGMLQSVRRARVFCLVGGLVCARCPLWRSRPANYTRVRRSRTSALRVSLFAFLWQKIWESQSPRFAVKSKVGLWHRCHVVDDLCHVLNNPLIAALGTY